MIKLDDTGNPRRQRDEYRGQAVDESREVLSVGDAMLPGLEGAPEVRHQLGVPHLAGLGQEELENVVLRQQNVVNCRLVRRLRVVVRRHVTKTRRHCWLLLAQPERIGLHPAYTCVAASMPAGSVRAALKSQDWPTTDRL